MTKLTPSLAIAQPAYAQIWHSTPFTTINMIQFSLKKTGLSIEDWIGGSPIDISRLECRLATVTDHDLKPLCATCASFAVGVRSAIGKNAEGLVYGDTGFHKASYSTTGVVIDSSAKTAFQLEGKEGQTFNERSLKLVESTLYFLRMQCLSSPLVRSYKSGNSI